MPPRVNWLRENLAEQRKELAQPPLPGHRLNGAQLDALGTTFGWTVGGTGAALLSATGLIPLAWWASVTVVVYALLVGVCRLWYIAHLRRAAARD